MDSENFNTMSDKELKELKSKIEFILQSRKSDTSNAELLYSNISEQLFQALKSPQPNYNVLKNKDKLKKVCQFLDDYLETLIPTPSKLIRNKFYYLFSKMIVQYIQTETEHIPLSLNSALNCHELFPSLLDKNFPGYIKSGVIFTVLK